MENNTMITKKMVFANNIDAGSDLEAIEVGAKILYEKGFVKESFIEAIQVREKVFPTGLPTEAIGVAIPHTDAEHVNESALAILVLNKPVLFKMMGSDTDFVEVKILFMMAIDEPHGQLEMLQKIITFIQNKEVLIKINKCKNEEEMNTLLKP